MVQAVQKQRVFAFDELRGVMILSMLVYHICYDLAELVRLRGMSWFYSEAAGLVAVEHLRSVHFSFGSVLRLFQEQSETRA